jgi:hypothetical protein
MVDIDENTWNSFVEQIQDFALVIESKGLLRDY